MFPSLACLWCFIPQDTKGKKGKVSTVSTTSSECCWFDKSLSVRRDDFWFTAAPKGITFWDHRSALTVGISCSPQDPPCLDQTLWLLFYVGPHSLLDCSDSALYTSLTPFLPSSSYTHSLSVSLCELVNHSTAVLLPSLYFCIPGMSTSTSLLLTLIIHRHTRIYRTMSAHSMHHFLHSIIMQYMLTFHIHCPHLQTAHQPHARPELCFWPHNWIWVPLVIQTEMESLWEYYKDNPSSAQQDKTISCHHRRTHKTKPQSAGFIVSLHVGYM